MSGELSPAAEALLAAVKKYPGLSTGEYASDLVKPVASVRRDLQALRARGLVRGETNPIQAEEDSYPKTTFYWWVPIED